MRKLAANIKNSILYCIAMFALKYSSKKKYFLGESEFSSFKKRYRYMEGISDSGYTEAEENAQAKVRYDELMSILKGAVPQSVCEIGPGSGMLLKQFINAGSKVVIGVDIQEPTYKDDRIKYVLDGVHEMNEIKDNSVDFIFSYDAFEHIPNPVEGMMNCLKKLKPGGICYFQIGPSYYSPWGFHYYHILKIPYIHILFPERILNEYAREKGILYPWTNRVPANKYVQFFQNLPDDYNLIDFKYDYTWYYCGFIAKYAGLFKAKTGLQLDDFLIGAMYGKIKKAGGHSYLRN